MRTARLLPFVFVLGIGNSVRSAPPAPAGGSIVSINADNVLVVNGRKIFPIGFTMPPAPDARTPSGTNGIAELRSAGANFLRTGPMGGPWDEAMLAREVQWENAAARNGMFCWPALRELGALGSRSAPQEAMLRRVVQTLKNNPGLGVWHGTDEPEWMGMPPAAMQRTRELIRKLDPNHPVAINQAPRGTVESLRTYAATGEITGADIYPISYPPGIHSREPNKDISMVGDYTRKMMDVAQGRQPVWMVLQIAWSGTVKAGRTLRMPTFPQERFMAYQAIINGARGLFFFGGHIPKAMTTADARLGWNWTFWRRVLRPVIEEIGENSPLYPALVAPVSAVKVTTTGASGMEFTVREAGNDLFLLAAKRGGETEQATFTGLPVWAARGEVLFEAARQVQTVNGAFTDWFAPYDVHVYRFRRGVQGGPKGKTASFRDPAPAGKP